MSITILTLNGVNPPLEPAPSLARRGWGTKSWEQNMASLFILMEWVFTLCPKKLSTTM